MKFRTFITMILAAALLGSCNTKKAQNTDDKADDNTHKKILVAYFSATGTTKKVAEDIAKVFDATLFEIEPLHPYTAEDLDWRDSTSRSTIEMKKDLSIRPEIKAKVNDIAQYDVVFLGYPVWWYIAPTIINSFLEENDLNGKTVYCFATSGGSPIGLCVDNLKKQFPDIKWEEGRLLNNATTSEIEAWKKELNL